MENASRKKPNSTPHHINDANIQSGLFYKLKKFVEVFSKKIHFFPKNDKIHLL